MQKVLFGLLIILAAACSSSKTTNYKQAATIGFYNVENLFDTIDNPKTLDEEFTPNSKKKYTSKIYNEKLNHLTKVITAFPEGAPAILGLCEVENKSVVEDLAQKIGANYQVAHIESKDIRGIDNALMYNSSVFKLESQVAIPITFEFDPDLKTRGILHVTGILFDEKVHIFVNHWPSRRGGRVMSNPNRMVAASTLRKAVDKILATDQNANIIIMGDFNDEPFNSSIREALQADSLIACRNGLYNSSHYLKALGLGSYNYKGNWNVLDQIIVSKALLSTKKKDLKMLAPYQAQVVKEEFMLYTTKSGDQIPSRSYGGNNYYGGYSDHLPVYIKVYK